MSGLVKQGVDASPFGSKFKDVDGGFDAGNGQRTYTRPSYTLFVTGIPDAESSDAVEVVFQDDPGFMQCRPIGHKKSRRMVFVDFDCIDHASLAMKRHQGHKWEDVDEGLKIDYDQDARCKRNTALDEGMFEKFWPIGPRVARAETDQELFARLRAEATNDAEPPSSLAAPMRKRPLAPVTFKAQSGAAARLHVKKTAAQGPEGPALADEPNAAAAAAEQAADTAQPGSLGGLAQYESESEDEEDEDDFDEDEGEEEESDDGDATVDVAEPAAKKPRL